MKKILVIDDEELLTKTFTLLLERNGYAVLTAKNGEDALAMCEEEMFDLIICDIRMPGASGIDTVRALWDKKSGEKIPVIFVSGYADEALEAALHALKPIAYFRKPFENQKLLEAVTCGLASSSI